MVITSSILSNTYNFARSTIKQQQPKELPGTQAQQVQPETVVAGEVKTEKTSLGPRAFSEVASNSRSALDAFYKKLGISSDHFGKRDGDLRREVFEPLNLDRRTLYAIASNEGGQFSDEEMSAAKGVMRSQVEKAMFGDVPELKPHAQMLRDYISFLDNEASPEEKASFEWATGRASAMAAYKLHTGRLDTDLKSDSAIVNLLFDANSELFEAYKEDMNSRLEDMPSYSAAFQQWQEEATSFGAYSFNFVV